MIKIFVQTLFSLALLGITLSCGAHGDSPTTLTLSPKGKTGWTIVLEAGLVEFHEVMKLPLSATGNQGVKFNKLFAQAARPYVEKRLGLLSDDVPCALKKIKTVKARDHHGLGLKLTMQCENRSRALAITYDLFTENDPTAGAELLMHKGKTTLSLTPGRTDVNY